MKKRKDQHTNQPDDQDFSADIQRTPEEFARHLAELFKTELGEDQEEPMLSGSRTRSSRRSAREEQERYAQDERNRALWEARSRSAREERDRYDREDRDLYFREDRDRYDQEDRDRYPWEDRDDREDRGFYPREDRTRYAREDRNRYDRDDRDRYAREDRNRSAQEKQARTSRKERDRLPSDPEAFSEALARMLQSSDTDPDLDDADVSERFTLPDLPAFAPAENDAAPAAADSAVGAAVGRPPEAPAPADSAVEAHTARPPEAPAPADASAQTGGLSEEEPSAAPDPTETRPYNPPIPAADTPADEPIDPSLHVVIREPEEKTENAFDSLLDPELTKAWAAAAVATAFAEPAQPEPPAKPEKSRRRSKSKERKMREPSAPHKTSGIRPALLGSRHSAQNAEAPETPEAPKAPARTLSDALETTMEPVQQVLSGFGDTPFMPPQEDLTLDQIFGVQEAPTEAPAAQTERPPQEAPTEAPAAQTSPAGRGGEPASRPVEGSLPTSAPADRDATPSDAPASNALLSDEELRSIHALLSNEKDLPLDDLSADDQDLPMDVLLTDEDLRTIDNLLAGNLLPETSEVKEEDVGAHPVRPPEPADADEGAAIGCPPEEEPADLTAPAAEGTEFADIFITEQTSDKPALRPEEPENEPAAPATWPQEPAKDLIAPAAWLDESTGEPAAMNEWSGEQKDEPADPDDWSDEQLFAAVDALLSQVKTPLAAASASSKKTKSARPSKKKPTDAPTAQTSLPVGAHSVRPPVEKPTDAPVDAQTALPVGAHSVRPPVEKPADVDVGAAIGRPPEEAPTDAPTAQTSPAGRGGEPASRPVEGSLPTSVPAENDATPSDAPVPAKNDEIPSDTPAPVDPEAEPAPSSAKVDLPPEPQPVDGGGESWDPLSLFGEQSDDSELLTWEEFLAAQRKPSQPDPAEQPPTPPADVPADAIGPHSARPSEPADADVGAHSVRPPVEKPADAPAAQTSPASRGGEPASRPVEGSLPTSVPAENDATPSDAPVPAENDAAPQKPAKAPMAILEVDFSRTPAKPAGLPEDPAASTRGARSTGTQSTAGTLPGKDSGSSRPEAPSEPRRRARLRRDTEEPLREGRPTHPEEAYRVYAQPLDELGPQMILTGLLTLLSLFFTLYLAKKWSFLPDVFSGSVTVYVLLGLLAALVVVNRRIYFRDWQNDRGLRPELLLGFATLFAALDCLSCASSLRAPFTVVVGAELLILLWGRYDRALALTTTVKVLRGEKRFAGVNEVPDIIRGSSGLVRTEPDVPRFLQKLETRDLTERVLRVYTPAAAIAGLALTLVIGLIFKRDIAWTGTLIFLGSLPVAGFLAFPRLFLLLSRRLSEANAALCGYYGAEVFGGEHSILIGDEDLFPAGSLALNGFKVFNGNPDRMIAYAASACHSFGSALDPIFEDLLASHNGRLYNVDSFRSYESGGIGATIQQDVVLLGSRDFMRRMGVHMDKGTQVKQAVYMSLNGELAAVFAMRYAPPENLRRGLNVIAYNRHFKGILVTRTFLGTPAFLKAKFGVPTGAFLYPPVKERVRLSEAEVKRSGAQGAILSKDSFAGFAQAAAGGRMLHSATFGATVLTLLGGAGGLTLMAILAALMALDTATALNLLLYAAVWLIPTLLLTVWGKHY